VAFSGHGVHVDGKSYLCPADAQVDKPVESMIAQSDVFEALERCRASLKLMLIDACRDDPRPPGRRSAGPTDITSGFADAYRRPPDGVLVLASCGARQASREHKELGHGVFMHYLLDGLRGSADRKESGNRNGRVSVKELYDYAYIETKTYVARVFNEYQSPELNGKISGKFEFGQLPTTPRPDTRELNHVGLQSMLALGDDYRVNRKYGRALQVYGWALELAPGNKAVHARRAATLFALGREQEALSERARAGGEPLPVILAENQPLRTGDEDSGTLFKGLLAYVTEIRGDWFWVSTVEGNRSYSGWLQKSAVVDPSGTTADASPSDPLVGTVWDATHTGGERQVFMFGPEGELFYASAGGFHAGATWASSGGTLTVTLNEGFLVLTGRVSGTTMTGNALTEGGEKWTWQAQRR
jgi:hypothetical protein